MEQSISMNATQRDVLIDAANVTKNSLNQKVLISDYDDTITRGTGDVFSLICKSVMGKEEYEQMLSLPKELGKDWFTAYLKFNSLTKNKTELICEEFKKSEIYKKFCEAKNESIDNILKKMQTIPNENVTEFYVKEILFPLIAMYSVYIEKLEPEEAFFILYQKSKENEDIFIINTYKPHEVILIELQEYVKLNVKKYQAFDEILKNNMVLGTTEESCKGDEDRIKFILNWKSSLMRTKTPEIIIMGDSHTDCVNFEEAQRMYPSSSTFLFVDTRLNQDIQLLNSNCNSHTCNCKMELPLIADSMKYCCDVLKKEKEKLEFCKRELQSIENKKSTFVKQILSGSYEEIVGKIYK